MTFAESLAWSLAAALAGGALWRWGYHAGYTRAWAVFRALGRRGEDRDE